MFKQNQNHCIFYVAAKKQTNKKKKKKKKEKKSVNLRMASAANWLSTLRVKA